MIYVSTANSFLFLNFFNLNLEYDRRRLKINQKSKTYVNRIHTLFLRTITVMHALCMTMNQLMNVHGNDSKNSVHLIHPFHTRVTLLFIFNETISILQLRFHGETFPHKT